MSSYQHLFSTHYVLDVVLANSDCYNKTLQSEGLKQHTFTSHCSGCWEVPGQGAGRPGDLLLGLQMAVFLLHLYMERALVSLPLFIRALSPP